MKIKTWDELKLEGSKHYNKTEIQSIDLYKSKGTFTPWAINEGTQHFQRNSPTKRDCFVEDMIKIIHYAELLIAEHIENTQNSQA